MLLTQSSAPVIGWVATILGILMEGIFNALNAVGIQNIGLCIIIFTFIIRIVLLPLMIKQQKFTKMTQAMQPELNKIQKKYRNKRDSVSMQKQQEETQALYDKYGISPTGGCLQMFIQFPILLALYQVIRKVPAYIPAVKASYTTIVESISGTPGYIDKVNTIAQALKSNYIKDLPADATTNQVIDVLNYFKTESWAELAKVFPNAADTINSVSAKIIHMNDFALGINVAQTPGYHPSIYWIIPALAALFQFLSMQTMQSNNSNANDQATQMTKSMTWMMPLMSLYFCLIMPAGLGIYWISSAAFQFVQQVVINAYYDRMDMDEMIAKNKEIAEAKRAKKKAKGKKSLSERMNNMVNEAETETAAKIDDKFANSPYGGRIYKAATVNTKKMNAEAKKVDMDTLGELGRNAHIVARYDEEQKAKGGKK